MVSVYLQVLELVFTVKCLPNAHYSPTPKTFTVVGWKSLRSVLVYLGLVDIVGRIDDHQMWAWQEPQLLPKPVWTSHQHSHFHFFGDKQLQNCSLGV